MKTCSKCQTSKPFTEFRYRSERQNWHSLCRACEADYQRQHAQKPEGRAQVMWQGIRSRANNAEGTRPTYADVQLRMTREEFFSWVVPLLEQWYQTHPNVVPTLDRINNAGHYELGNLRIVSGKENTHWRGSNKNVHAPTGTAWCRVCKQYLPTERFSKDKHSSHGLQHMCKDCTSKNHTKGKYRWISEDEQKAILKRYNAGENGNQISKDCGRSAVFIYRLLRRAKAKGLIV